MDKNNRQKAFTLIELLVAISIMAVFSGLSLAAYNDFAETKKLEAETKKFVEVLELAKKKISSGDKSNLDTYSGCDLTGFKIAITSNTEYSLKAVVCQNNNIQCETSFIDCTDDINISSYETSSKITLSSPVEIVFYPLGLGADDCKCITITNTVLTKSKYIKIEKSGVINILNDPCLCT